MTGDDQVFRKILVRLDALGGGPDVLRRSCARVLGELDPPRSTALLQSAMQLSRARWLPAVRVLPALFRALEEDGDLIPHLDSLQHVAVLHAQHDVGLIFTEAAPAMEYQAEAAARADAKLFTLPLGVLKSRARLTLDPDELATLAVATNPAVIREVLKNPRLTEPLVVRIAARRPARPEPLLEIWKSHRWNTRTSIRKALVFNPFFPPESGVKIVPLLGQSTLKELAQDTKVHPSVRELAVSLCASAR